VKEGLRRVAVLAAISILLAGLVVTTLLLAPSQTTAPEFSAVDIDGNPVNLSDFRGKVVVLDFMATWCGSCKIVEKNLKQLAPKYGDQVQIISIDIDSLETTQMVRAYRDENEIPWIILIDNASLGLKEKYAASEISKIVVVDAEGIVTHQKFVGLEIANPDANRDEIDAAIQRAISGDAPPVSIQQLSIVGLVILAAVGSFFSPCAFPMLPGYMTYFLGTETKKGEEVGWKRAVSGGLVSGLGIVSVYMVIGAVVIILGNATKPYIPLLGPVVGIILIVLGALMLTNLQYWAIIRPFQRLRERLFPSKDTGEGGESTLPGLFGYGVGYGAAASACVAPLFIAAVVNAAAFGDVMQGLGVLLLYAVVVILLMLVITISLSLAGQAAVQKLTKYTGVIEKVSGIALLAVGVYLVYFYYAAWVVPG
jgi:cytochrome c-type biogenesis protein